MKYDYLIVGAGLFGSVFAWKMRHEGKSVLVIDKREHIGGNCYTENIEGINVHKYGAHIFNTNNHRVWNFFTQFATFNNYVNRPKVNYKGKIYSFPINLMTLHQVAGVQYPEEAKRWVESRRVKNDNPQNLEEWILDKVGPELYEIFIKGYTEKQWGRPAKELPASIMRRIPIRFNFDENYYNSKYQGIPIGGYTKIFELLLAGCDVELGNTFNGNASYWANKASKIIYTGPIDEYFGYKYGKLDYRTLKFSHSVINSRDYLGNAVVNFTDINVDHTRILEHKHFEFGEQEKTVVTFETPFEHKMGDVPYYPINTERNKEMYRRYKNAKTKHPIIFGGRLAEYRYYSMDEAIASALSKADKEVASW